MCGLEKLGIVDQTGWNVVVRFVAENPGTFSQQTLLGALIMTGRSASCFLAPNSVLLAESVDTTFAVHQQGEELLEKIPPV